MRSTSSKGTPTVGTGRRTPSSIRPPSPKIDLSSKKGNDSKPSPSPKQQLGRSLTSSRKSPSNITESNFVSHDRALRKVQSSYNESYHRHDEADTEQSSVRSVLNEGQLAKIKIVVDHQKSKLPVYVDNDYEPEQVSRQFYSVSNVRSAKVDHDLDFNTYRDSFADENYYGESRQNENTFSHSFDDGRDDCAVSDITTEAVYMSINESRKIPSGVNSQIMSSGASVFEPSSLPDLQDAEIDHMMKVLAEEKARRALQQQQQQQQQLFAQNQSQNQYNATLSTINNSIPADASSIRKNVKRAKSGGNEAMMTKKNSSTAAGGSGNGGIKGTLPSFHTYRQRLDAGDASVVSQSEESFHSQQPQHHHQFETTIDWEVERALQGLQQPVRSASPAGLLSHSGAFTQSIKSPAGVSSAPHSRGTTLSRGSGAHVPADKMWAESSPSHYSSPLVYVESPNTTAGMNLIMANSGRLTADPVRDCNSRGPRNRPDNGDVEEHHSFSRSAGNNSVHKTRALESFREAKQYSSQHPENFKQQQVHVERFMPLDASTPSGSSHGKSHHNSAGQHSSSTHHSSPRAAKDSVQIVKPIIRSSSSVSSDISSVDGLSFHSHGQQSHNQQISSHAGAFTAANSHTHNESRAKDMRATYDALLNREFLVSPLSAFDDASHGSWSVNSGRSRRSSTSTTQKPTAKQPHYMAPKGPHTTLKVQTPSSHGTGHSSKHHSATPIKKSTH